MLGDDEPRYHTPTASSAVPPGLRSAHPRPKTKGHPGVTGGPSSCLRAVPSRARRDRFATLGAFCVFLDFSSYQPALPPSGEPSKKKIPITISAVIVTPPSESLGFATCSPDLFAARTYQPALPPSGEPRERKIPITMRANICHLVRLKFASFTSLCSPSRAPDGCRSKQSSCHLHETMVERRQAYE